MLSDHSSRGTVVLDWPADVQRLLLVDGRTPFWIRWWWTLLSISSLAAMIASAFIGPYLDYIPRLSVLPELYVVQIEQLRMRNHSLGVDDLLAIASLQVCFALLFFAAYIPMACFSLKFVDWNLASRMDLRRPFVSSSLGVAVTSMLLYWGHYSFIKPSDVSFRSGLPPNEIVFVFDGLVLSLACALACNLFFLVLVLAFRLRENHG